MDSNKKTTKFIHGIDNYKCLHIDMEHKLRRFSVTPVNRKKLMAEAVENLNLRARPHLPAGNLRVRIGVAEELLNRFCSASLASDGAYHFVTLVPTGFTTASTSGEGPSFEGLRVWAEQALADLNFIAGIDVGAYVSLAFQAGRRSTVFSWHVHAVVWGADEPYVHGLVHGCNVAMPPLLPGFMPAHYRKVSPAGCAKRLLYSLKFPLNEFQAWPTAGVGHDPSSKAPPFWKQRAKPIRTGTAALISNQLATSSMDEIVFGGGEGQPMVADALRVAQAEMELKEKGRMTRLYGR